MRQRRSADFHNELDTALAAAKAAGRVQLKALDRAGKVRLKADASPQTRVDRDCEKLISGQLLRRFPRDGFLGEESGDHPGTSGRRWIVDPLDGTRPYIRGLNTFSALIALEDEAGPAVGVIHLPALGLTCWAARGGGAFANGRPIHVSRTPRLKKALGSALGFVEKAGKPQGRALLRLMRAYGYNYGFMDAYSYAALAMGRLDACVNLLDKPWDCAAAACIVEEAGGRFSDLKGRRTVHSGNCVLSNGRLHEKLLAFFR